MKKLQAFKAQIEALQVTSIYTICKNQALQVTSIYTICTNKSTSSIFYPYNIHKQKHFK